ncbi:hypothetical protein MSG28_009207 [Choristoneura fumiferana]|uniref:Uncharacterized protein n=1 Tax=Choristoneura fumiferana TaxID=7141 RepID=A0ACC0KX26_CHOFU|nr:hypothetical protein MSG28_009207 [Choristoneura fumiferana]
MVAVETGHAVKRRGDGAISTQTHYACEAAGNINKRTLPAGAQAPDVLFPALAIRANAVDAHRRLGGPSSNATVADGPLSCRSVGIAAKYQLKLDEKKENTPDTLNGASLLQSITGNSASITATSRLPRAVHEELALILKRIGSKEHNREALASLYELRERHPEVDIWTFMQGSSFYFRNYVERGLREVAEQRKLSSMPYRHDFKSENIDISNETEEKSHLVFMERLRILQQKAGMKTESAPTSQPRTPVSDNRALADSIIEHTLPRAHSIDPQLERWFTAGTAHGAVADGHRVLWTSGTLPLSRGVLRGSGCFSSSSAEELAISRGLHCLAVLITLRARLSICKFIRKVIRVASCKCTRRSTFCNAVSSSELFLNESSSYQL